MTETPAGLRVYTAETTPPEPYVLVRNATDRDRSLSVGLACNGRSRRASFDLPARTERVVGLPDGDGPITADIHTDAGTATVSFESGTSAPLFSLRDRSVLVASN